MTIAVTDLILLLQQLLGKTHCKNTSFPSAFTQKARKEWQHSNEPDPAAVIGSTGLFLSMAVWVRSLI